MRAMVRVITVAALAGLLGGCNCGPTGVDQKRFACADDAHCTDGFVCRANECVRAGAAGGSATAGGGSGTSGGGVAGGGEAGGPAGGSTAGGATAGGATAGGATAGGATAGGATAGGATAGGATAGGATAGGATAGGATAGGATAGGATAGGATAGGATAGGATAGGAAPMPTSLVFTTTPPSPLLAGMCYPATIEARIGGAATPVTSSTMVGLGVSLSGGVRFFSSSSCSTTLSTVTIPGGSATATFYVRPRSGTAMTVTATAPFGMAQQMINPRPVVRRGTCSYSGPVGLPDGGTSLQFELFCPVSPPQTGMTPAQTSVSPVAFLFSASGPGPDIGAHTPTCWIHSENEVRCTRGRASQSAIVNWQTAELPNGSLRVQAFGGVCGADVGHLMLSSAVDPASTFLLRSSSTGGAALTDDDGATFRLVSPTSIRKEHAGCVEYDVQAVEVPGVTVTRQLHDGGLPAGATELTVTGLPAASVNTVLFTQARTESTPVAFDCSLTLRGHMPSPTSVTVQRADGGCEGADVKQVFWERVDFNQSANVQAITVTMSGLMQDVAISPVDTTRTLVMSSSQIFAGQAVAEAGVSGEAEDAAIRFDLTSPTNVRLYRGDSDGPVTVTFYVIEIEP